MLKRGFFLLLFSAFIGLEIFPISRHLSMFHAHDIITAITERDQSLVYAPMQNKNARLEFYHGKLSTRATNGAMWPS
ncbi:hypothetical protein V8C37DRAFT_367201 [Trichoderma ceciliae]